MVEELSGTDMMSLKNSRFNDNCAQPQIVVADDKYINTSLLQLKFQQVQIFNFTHFCGDGKAAVNTVESIVNKALLKAKTFPVKPISIILLDINMP